ncbi:MAG: DUF2970 domain-containing protein [Alcaligenaceae bacterium]|nr:DUF2970 domain-containing protein [Alcaligenaceae bacterium]
MSDDLKELSRRKLSFFQTLKAILWGFLGIRKGASYHEDISKLNPVHIIIAGIIGVLIFIFVLVMVARWAISGLT